MSGPPFRLAALAAEHDRSTFDCGCESLDSYFRQQVTQDVRRRLTSCFVAVTSAQRVAGYYTVAAAGVPLVDLPASIAQKLPRYPSVPAVRMGRLAVDRQFKGQGLGGALLADALTLATRAQIAAYALVVDAKDESAAGFYRHHGFIALPNAPLTLFLPLATAQALRG